MDNSRWGTEQVVENISKGIIGCRELSSTNARERKCLPFDVYEFLRRALTDSLSEPTDKICRLHVLVLRLFPSPLFIRLECTDCFYQTVPCVRNSAMVTYPVQTVQENCYKKSRTRTIRSRQSLVVLFPAVTEEVKTYETQVVGVLQISISVLHVTSTEYSRYDTNHVKYRRKRNKMYMLHQSRLLVVSVRD